MASQAFLTLAPGTRPASATFTWSADLGRLRLLRADRAFPGGSAELVYAPGEPDPGHQAGVLD